MAYRVKRFKWKASDPLVAQHQLVAKVVETAVKNGYQPHERLDLKKVRGGKEILESEPHEAAGLMEALVMRLRHLDSQAREVRSRLRDIIFKANWHHEKEWELIWPERQATFLVLSQVMRRKLPIAKSHISAFVSWMNESEKGWLHEYFFPFKGIVRMVESAQELINGDKELKKRLRVVEKKLRRTNFKEAKNVAYRLENLFGN